MMGQNTNWLPTQDNFSQKVYLIMKSRYNETFKNHYIKRIFKNELDLIMLRKEAINIRYAT